MCVYNYISEQNICILYLIEYKGNTSKNRKRCICIAFKCNYIFSLSLTHTHTHTLPYIYFSDDGIVEAETHCGYVNVNSV